MKLSNKILIGFFGFILLYMIAAFTELRIKGDVTVFTEQNSLTETEAIPDVSYLIFSDFERSITILGSDKPRIEVRSTTGDLLQHLKHEISCDTLFIKKSDYLMEQRLTLFIYVPRSGLKEIISTGTGVTISDLNQDLLSIHQSDGWIKMKNTNRLGKIKLEAQNSAYFEFTDGEVDTLYAMVDSSQVTVRTPLKRIEGSMKLKSYISVGDVEEIQFKKDKSSQLYFN